MVALELVKEQLNDDKVIVNAFVRYILVLTWNNFIVVKI